MKTRYVSIAILSSCVVSVACGSDPLEIANDSGMTNVDAPVVGHDDAGLSDASTDATIDALIGADGADALIDAPLSDAQINSGPVDGAPLDGPKDVVAASSPATVRIAVRTYTGPGGLGNPAPYEWGLYWVELQGENAKVKQVNYDANGTIMPDAYLVHMSTSGTSLIMKAKWTEVTYLVHDVTTGKTKPLPYVKDDSGSWDYRGCFSGDQRYYLHSPVKGSIERIDIATGAVKTFSSSKMAGERLDFGLPGSRPQDGCFDASGNLAVFASKSQLVSTDTDANTDVYVWDVAAGTVTLASPMPSNVQTNALTDDFGAYPNGWPFISPDGHRILLGSHRADLATTPFATGLDPVNETYRYGYIVDKTGYQRFGTLTNGQGAPLNDNGTFIDHASVSSDLKSWVLPVETAANANNNGVHDTWFVSGQDAKQPVLLGETGCFIKPSSGCVWLSDFHLSDEGGWLAYQRLDSTVTPNIQGVFLRDLHTNGETRIDTLIEKVKKWGSYDPMAVRRAP